MAVIERPDRQPERPLLGVSGRGIAGVYRGYCRMKPEAFGGAWEVAADGCLRRGTAEMGRKADIPLWRPHPKKTTSERVPDASVFCIAGILGFLPISG